MTEAVRSVKHGVAVVPHDFKAHLERASAYKPERKKYSGYDEPVTTRQVPSEPMWQSVVDDWHQSDSIEYNNSIDDDSTRERSLSQSSDMVDLSNASDKQERQPIKVEKLSPTLLDEWKKAQAQGMIKSLDKKAVNKDDSEAKLRHRSASGDSSSYVRQTASVDSVLSARSIGSDIILPPTRTSSNGSVHSTHSRIMTPPAYVDFTKPPPSTAGGLGDFVRPYSPTNPPSPPVIAAGSASYPNVTYPAPAVFGAQQSYVRPQPVNNFMIPGVTNTGGYNVQPIGTPALGAMRQHMVPMHAPVQTPMAQLPDTWFKNYLKADNCISRLTVVSPSVTAVSPWFYPKESACTNYQCGSFIAIFPVFACIVYLLSAAARIKVASSRARKSLCLPTEQQL